MKALNYKQETIQILKELTKSYPDQALSTHIHLALSEYDNFYGISDKELYYIFNKYRCEKELDILPDISCTDDIYKDSMNLNIEDILNEDDED